jgi:oligopeptide/dipeptide ABC transporter ATP-binding protein
VSFVASGPSAAGNAPPLIDVRDLRKVFPVRRGLFSRIRGEVRAVDGISFALARGETLALVGESGSGKTTAARALLRLVEPSGGSVLYRRDGEAPVDLLTLAPRELRRARAELAIVFQDPWSSLNPRLSVGEIVGEGLRAHGIARGAELEARVAELLERVGLERAARERYPHEFSGGQRQRIGIARALATSPRFVVLDEAVSALDVSIQGQILNLLQDLQAELGLAYLFIAHDLSLVRYLADRVAVMFLGRIVEIGTTAEVFERPAHPYTQALLSAIPSLDPQTARARIVLTGELPSALAPPSGCRFRTRCPLAEARCARIDPGFVQLSPTHRAACLLLDGS